MVSLTTVYTSSLLQHAAFVLMMRSYEGTNNDNDDHAVLAMPEEVHSGHALTFIGLSKKAANDIVGRWTSYEKDLHALPDDID